MFVLFLVLIESEAIESSAIVPTTFVPTALVEFSHPKNASTNRSGHGSIKSVEDVIAKAKENSIEDLKAIRAQKRELRLQRRRLAHNAVERARATEKRDFDSMNGETIETDGQQGEEDGQQGEEEASNVSDVRSGSGMPIFDLKRPFQVQWTSSNNEISYSD